MREVLKALFASGEFRDSYGRKYQTPCPLVAPAVRAAGVPLNDSRPLLNVMSQLGMPLFGCVTPDGYKNTEEAWLSPDATTRRIGFATAFANGGIAVGGSSVDAAHLQQIFASILSSQTRDTIARAPAGLRAALILGSPDFM